MYCINREKLVGRVSSTTRYVLTINVHARIKRSVKRTNCICILLFCNIYSVFRLCKIMCKIR